MLCPIKVNGKTIELTLHTYCYCVYTYAMLIVISLPLVVSIGHSGAFYVVFIPLDYVPNIP